MPHGAWRATACALNGLLCVMGGGADDELQVLEMTEERWLFWLRKADLPAIRYGAASVVHDGKGSQPP